MKFRKVLIESRYAPSFPKPKAKGPEEWASHSEFVEHYDLLDKWHRELARNIAYARLAMRDCLLRCEAPYASHLLYTQDGVLDDTVAEERERGMLAGFAYRDAVEASVFYVDLGMSRGMLAGLDDALKKKRPIWWRSMPNWEKGDATSIALSPVEAVSRLPELKDSTVTLPGTMS